MQLLCPEDRSRSIALRLDRPGSGGVGLLGGCPPGDVEPRRLSGRFFVTVPLAVGPELLVSVFLAPPDDLVACRAVIRRPDAIEVVVHSGLRRSATSPFQSGLTEADIVIAGEQDDVLPDEELGTLIQPGHKIGGNPHLVWPNEALERDIDALWRGGFSLVAQIDRPTPDDYDVEGEWPLDGGIFCLFAKPPFSEGDFRWYWDF